jgi:hypothetical protein
MVSTTPTRPGSWRSTAIDPDRKIDVVSCAEPTFAPRSTVKGIC